MHNQGIKVLAYRAVRYPFPEVSGEGYDPSASHLSQQPHSTEPSPPNSNPDLPCVPGNCLTLTLRCRRLPNPDPALQAIAAVAERHGVSQQTVP